MTTVALARRTDPETSHTAAEGTRFRAPVVRQAVLTVLREADEPLTHDRLIGRYNTAAAQREDWPVATASSIRTRCHELVKEGLVEQVPDAVGKSATGRRARLWRATADA